MVFYAGIDPKQALEHLRVHSVYIEPGCAEQANNFLILLMLYSTMIFYNYEFHKYNFKYILNKEKRGLFG